MASTVDFGKEGPNNSTLKAGTMNKVRQRGSQRIASPRESSQQPSPATEKAGDGRSTGGVAEDREAPPSSTR